MCTALLDVSPASPWPVLLVATRDEFTTRPWEPPGRWWPEAYPAAHGGYDREAGGSWLAVNPDEPAVAVVLNGPDGPDATGRRDRLSRGELPLRAVTGRGLPDHARLGRFRPFHLVRLTACGAEVVSWDGRDLSRTALAAGTHLIGNLGLDRSDDPRTRRWLPRLRACPRPAVDDSRTAEECWRPWLALMREARPQRARTPDALVVRATVGDSVHATLSLSGIALGEGAVRYDFARLRHPGVPDQVDWQRVL